MNSDKNHCGRRQAGISIVEQLVTMVVISTAVLGVTKYQVSLYDAELNSKQRAEAVSLAQQKLEVLKSAGYDAAAVSGQDFVQGSTARFNRDWSVTPDPALAYDQANVTVTWSTKGRSNSASLDTRIANAPPATTGQFMLGLLSGAAVASPPSSTGTTATASVPVTPVVETNNPPVAAVPGGVPVVPSSTTPGGNSATVPVSPVGCTCSKSRHGQSYAYTVPEGQSASCTIAMCSAAPGQCAPTNNTSCNYVVTLSI
jgi:Tfp pilus assembly protein PilV